MCAAECMVLTHKLLHICKSVLSTEWAKQKTKTTLLIEYVIKGQTDKCMGTSVDFVTTAADDSRVRHSCRQRSVSFVVFIGKGRDFVYYL